jgi:hypothetical protein
VGVGEGAALVPEPVGGVQGGVGVELHDGTPSGSDHSSVTIPASRRHDSSIA